jgi:hypothetical protein
LSVPVEKLDHAVLGEAGINLEFAQIAHVTLVILAKRDRGEHSRPLQLERKVLSAPQCVSERA